MTPQLTIAASICLDFRCDPEVKSQYILIKIAKVPQNLVQCDKGKYLWNSVLYTL